MMKMPYTSVGRHININVKATRKLPPSWLYYIVLEGYMQVARIEKTSLVLSRLGQYMLNYQTSRTDVPAGAIVQPML